MATRKVTLTRYFTDGTPAPLIEDVTLAKAGMYVSMSLFYNGAATRKEADKFSHVVTSAPRGTKVEHPSGHSYMIT